jgi:hypothetical protein
LRPNPQLIYYVASQKSSSYFRIHLEEVCVMRLSAGFLAALLAVLAFGDLTHAAFHLIRIEQIIGGVNGDTTAQAVQLRVRSGSQPFIAATRVTAVDATGSNLVILKDFSAADEATINASQGNRILLATPNFANYTSVPLTPDFIMDPIPSSYLAAGQVRFTNDAGNLRYWLVSWGGAGYTGIQTGTTDNDANGNFSPAVNGALPSTTLQALRFTPTSVTALSTTNLADYALTAGSSVWINNDGASATLVTPPPTGLDGDFNDDDVVDAADYVNWRKLLGTNSTLNGNGDETGASAGVVDQADYNLWQANFGDTAPGSGGGAGPIPEPASLTLVLTAALLAVRRRRSNAPSR